MIYTTDMLVGRKVKSRITGYEYTVLGYRNKKKRGPEIKINNWASYYNCQQWWPLDRFIPVEAKKNDILMVIL